MNCTTKVSLGGVAAFCFAFAPFVAKAQEAGATEESAAAPAEGASPAAAEPAKPPADEVTPVTIDPPPEEVTEAAPDAAGDTGEEAPEEIVVTGTRIKRKAIATAAPVSVLSRDELLGSGMVSIGEILQNLPSQGNGINVNFNNGGTGSTRVNMRGLDSNRTLVLINGRRHVAGGTGANASVDLNAIPIAVIDRVEVLKDGASAVYGSDAIGGVVNIITRSDFEGAVVNGYTGTTQRGDGQIYDLSVTAGTTSSKGSLVFSAGFFEQVPIWAGDRSYGERDRVYDFRPPCGDINPQTNDPYTGNSCYDADTDANPDYDDGRVSDSGSPGTPQGTIWDSSGDPGNADWQAIAGPDHTQWAQYYNDPDDGWRPFNNAGSSDAGTGDLYNYQPENYLVTPQKRYNIWTQGKYEFSEYIRGYFEGSYTNRKSSQKLAPEPLYPDPSDGFTISADNRYNPFERDFLYMGRRMVEQGNRVFLNDIDTFRLVLGIDGALPDLGGPLVDWTWDFHVNFGRTEGATTNTGSYNVNRLAMALGPDDACQADDECVPLNLFGGEGTITQEMLDYIEYTGVARGFSEQQMTSLSLTGPLFELVDDNPVAVAVGYEYRVERGGYVPDPLTASGAATGNAQLPTHGKYNVHASYLELSLPVLGGLPGVELLELSAAARFFKYDTFGSDITYKAGLRWQIMKYLAARGTYSSAFRAPSVNELYGGTSDSHPAVSDPCSVEDTAGNTVELPPNVVENCAAQGVSPTHTDTRTQLRTRVGGNPDLQPETADIITAGVVLEPTLVRGLSAAFDYWSIEMDDALNPVGAGIILSSCYRVDPKESVYCDLVERESNGRIVNIHDIERNTGGLKTSGVDFDVRYSLPSPAGRFGINLEGTYLIEFTGVLENGYEWEFKNNYDAAGARSSSTGGVYPDWKVNGTLLWAYESLSAGYSVRWISGIKECANSNLCNRMRFEFANGNEEDEPFSRDVDGNITMDLYAGIAFDTFLGESDLTIGCNNLLDQDPPVIYTGFLANSDAASYDYMGRYFYARLGHSF